MIPTTDARTVKTGGVMAGAEFGISLADSAHIMTILRDTLYSDKILAVIREYSANAWDAHRQVGKSDVPIEVHLPTEEEPVFSVRDHGPGLSRDDVFEVYTQYGASTKRNDNAAVGMLGIGSKSGFAYSDTFTVTSRHGGTKSTYVAMLDPSDKGVISLLNEEPCGAETGITIEIPVKPRDNQEFRSRASRLYVHFDPRPVINVHLEAPPAVLAQTKSGKLMEVQGASVVAVMGCIPYRVDINQVMDFEEGLPEFMRNLSAELLFDIGEVHVNASREELKYSDRTRRAIIDRYNALVEEYVREAVAKIRSSTTNIWERRLAAQGLQNFGVFCPDDIKDLTKGWVPIKQDSFPKVQVQDATGQTVDINTIHLFRKKMTVTQVSVSRDVRFIIRDTTKPMKGYNIGYNDIMVGRSAGPRRSFEQVEADLRVVIEASELTGVPVVRLSSLPWSAPVTNRSVNLKHGQKFFVYDPDAAVPYNRRWKRGGSRSHLWQSVDRVPTDEDVYVEIVGFEPTLGDMLGTYKDDLALCERFDYEMPEVYGYKITKRDPSKARQGTHYDDWRTGLMKHVVAHPAFQEIMDHEAWKEVLSERFYADDAIPGVDKALGKKHVISEFLREYNGSTRKNVKYQDRHEFSQIYRQVEGVLPDEVDLAKQRPQLMLAEILGRYKIFALQGVGLEALRVESDRPTWFDYIKLVDSQRGEEK